MRSELNRGELTRLVRHVPFQPFVLTFDGGVRVVVGHPENIALDSDPLGRPEVYIIGGGVRHYGTLEAISTISTVDNPNAQTTGA